MLSGLSRSNLGPLTDPRLSIDFSIDFWVEPVLSFPPRFVPALAHGHRSCLQHPFSSLPSHIPSTWLVVVACCWGRLVRSCCPRCPWICTGPDCRHRVGPLTQGTHYFYLFFSFFSFLSLSLVKCCLLFPRRSAARPSDELQTPDSRPIHTHRLLWGPQTSSSFAFCGLETAMSTSPTFLFWFAILADTSREDERQGKYDQCSSKWKVRASATRIKGYM